MSDETVYNLLRGTSAQAQTSTGHVAFKFALTKALEVGKTYTFSVDVDELSNGATDSPYIGPNDGNGHVRYCTLYGTGHKVGTFTVGNLDYDESVYDFASFAIYNTPGLAGTWETTNRLVIRNAMLVEGTTPAAWAPAEGEELAGGGAQMSTNLLEGIAPTGTTESDGVWHSVERTRADGHDDLLVWDLGGQSALATNQTYRFGLSAKGASADADSLCMGVGYKDAAGHKNWVFTSPFKLGTTWQRFEGTAVVPSGMTPFGAYVVAFGVCPETWMASPTLSYGSPVTLAISSSTLAWSAGILATVRYYQLASPTSATPAVPASSSDLGAWSETEPEADVTKVLWTCERTVYADGTESWSKASKSTSYEAAKDAKSTATDAQQKAQTAQEQVVDVSTRLDQNTDNLTATIESKVTLVQQDVDSNTNDVSELNKRLTSEIKARRSFMRFSEESSDPTLTLGQTNSPAQVKLTNKQLQFLYLNTVVAYMSGDALLINNAKILQQLQLGGFAFVPRQNGNLSLKWVGGDV